MTHGLQELLDLGDITYETGKLVWFDLPSEVALTNMENRHCQFDMPKMTGTCIYVFFTSRTGIHAIYRAEFGII